MCKTMCLGMSAAVCGVLALVLLTGCSDGSPDGEDLEPTAPAGTTLKVLIVDDPQLAAAVGHLAGEWQAVSGLELEVTQVAGQDFDPTEDPRADAVICASHYLGVLAGRERVVAVPDELLGDGLGNWLDLFSLLREKEVKWKGDVMGVPFGSPVLTCYYRADLLEKLNRPPPTTWSEYEELARLLSDPDVAPGDTTSWIGAVEPLSIDWAGPLLLARAAAYTTHRANYSTTFNISTMEPLVAGAPFVRALEDLIAVAGTWPEDAFDLDPAGVRAAFWEGRCGLALTWPSAAADNAEPEDAEFRVGVVELPGSTATYDVSENMWDERNQRESPHVTLLATAGRTGMVTTNCPWPEAAFELLFWLSADRWSVRVSGADPATTMFRQSHLASPGAWVEKPFSLQAAVAYAAATEQALTREQSLLCLRIPGRTEYLAALGEAVRRAVRDGQPADEALGEVADQWREITAGRGLESQRTAYRHSLGLD